jgi:uncharacterized protein YkwD
MKNIIFILILTLTTLSLSAQTQLDYLVLEKINEYRIENGLPELGWCDKTYLASKHHTEYMIKVGDVLHREKNNTPKPSDRLLLYNVDFNICGENCTSVLLREDYLLTVEEMANHIVQNWKDSPTHNSIMLDNDFNSGAVSCGVGHLQVYGNSHEFMLSTLNVSN